jgi:hypothetical protein
MEWLICKVINKLNGWAPHIFCMAKHRTLLHPDNYNQTKYHRITLPFTAVLQSCICFRMRINLTEVVDTDSRSLIRKLG